MGHMDPHGGRGRLHLLLTQVLLPSPDTLADTPRNALYLLPEHRGSMEVTPGTDLKPHPAFSGLGLVQHPAIFFFFDAKTVRNFISSSSRDSLHTMAKELRVKAVNLFYTV